MPHKRSAIFSYSVVMTLETNHDFVYKSSLIALCRTLKRGDDGTIHSGIDFVTTGGTTAVKGTKDALPGKGTHREKERERERKRERESERERDRQTDRDRETERQRERETQRPLRQRGKES